MTAWLDFAPTGMSNTFKEIAKPIIFGSIVLGAAALFRPCLFAIWLVVVVSLDLCFQTEDDITEVIKACDQQEQEPEPELIRFYEIPGSEPRRYKCERERKQNRLTRLAPSFKSSGTVSELREMVQRIKPRPEGYEALQEFKMVLDNLIARKLQIQGKVTGFAYASPFIESPMVRHEPEISISVAVDLAQYHPWVQQSVQNEADSLLESSSKAMLNRIKKCFPGQPLFADGARFGFVAPIQHTRYLKQACMQLAINDPLPIRGGKLMEFCNKFQSIASDLVLLVQQWARWRAICLVSKGDLHLYVWTILVIFYLQIQGLLPPFVEHIQDGPKCTLPCKRSIMRAHFFKGFFTFYNKDFNFSTEVVSVSTGARCIRKHPSPTSLCIEDPFDAQYDPTSCVTAERISLLKQELQRGDRLCSSCSSLSDLFACPGNTHV